MYAINKQDAQWLARAAADKRYRPMLALVNVATNQFGHCAATTNGHRLHVLEIDKKIPTGLYEVDKKTGTLTPVAPPEGQNPYPDWCQIVPVKYTGILEAPVTTTTDSEGHQIYKFPNDGYIDQKLFDQAIPKGTQWLAKMNTWRQPIKIEIKGTRQQFAVIMPRWHN